MDGYYDSDCFGVSTHSRAKAAACILMHDLPTSYAVSTHSRAKAAAALKNYGAYSILVSTHSRAKAAAKVRQ